MSLLKIYLPKRIDGYFRRLITGYRQSTWRQRALPNFIIIGAQKCGTSSLFYYLGQHPQLIPSVKKEIHFFDGGSGEEIDQYELGLPWYCSHFPLRIQVKDGKQTFEASPSYIFHPLVPARISQAIPQVRLITLLRNPTDRAISHYLHESRKGRETLPIREALEQEENRLKDVFENKDFRNIHFRLFSYKSRGLYRTQLERYLEYFSKEQILIIPSEQFFANPQIFLRKVFEFIGVDPHFRVKDLKPRNVSPVKPEVDPEVYDYLDEFFRPHNQALYEFAGADFGW